MSYGCAAVTPIQVNSHQHIVDTTLIPLGDLHLRAHRVTLDPNSAAEGIHGWEGSAPLGYDAGAVPTIYYESEWVFAEFATSAVGIKPLTGYPVMAMARPGSANSVYAYNLVAVLSTTVTTQHDLICLVYAGGSPEVARFPTVERFGWNDAGEFTVRVNGELITVPPLA